MNIAIIDAEIVGKSKHRFPNLCCMKISSYHKQIGDVVTLKTDYENLNVYDKVYISKVFTSTEIPDEPQDKSGKKDCNKISEYYSSNKFLQQDNIEYGGTGFFYDKAKPLPEEIEHSRPDYHLYDDWVQSNMAAGVKRKEFTYYLDYSIGYLTRRCFRKCYYCVNRNYNKAIKASNLEEFLDKDRPKICLLDDNFFACPNWQELIEPVIKSGKRFQFKQGLDERLLNKEKILLMKNWKYDGDFIFAFDNIEDKELIISKLELIKQYASDKWRRMKFYVFCGCDKNNVYDMNFWHKDISDLFERIQILISYGALPYVMRFEKVYDTEFSTFYAAVAAWCNQPAMLKTFDFRLFCECKGMRKNGYDIYKRDIDSYLNNIGIKGACWKAMEQVENYFPDIADKYYTLKVTST